MRAVIARALTLLAVLSARAGEPQTLAGWSARSDAHARIVAVLEDHQRRLEAARSDPTASTAEADAVLGRLAECDVAALRDMTIGLEVDGLRGHRVVLARGLASSPSEGARAALKEVLGRVTQPYVYLAAIRALPKTPESVALLLELFDVQERPLPLRVLLLREVAARDAFVGDGRARLVRLLGEESDTELLAEALAVTTRTGDRALLEPLRALWARVTTLPVRQRLLVAYAEVGKDEALEFIDTATAGADLAVRATGVLAIARVGTPAALERLDRIAKEDPSEEVRARAARVAGSLRLREEAREAR